MPLVIKDKDLKDFFQQKKTFFSIINSRKAFKSTII